MKTGVNLNLAIAGLMSFAASLTGATAQGATMSEADLATHEYSADFRSPTEVAFGVDTITGVGGVGGDDYFVFTGLPSGAQDIVLNHFAPEGYGNSYSGGGVVLFQNTPFAYEWAGERLTPSIQVDHANPSQSVTLSLEEAFTGSLHLAQNFTHGENLRYSIFAESNGVRAPDFSGGSESGLTTPSEVPLPPALWLLGSGVLGLVYVGRARKA